MIELKKDDPTALRNVLRSLYKLPIEPASTDKETWRFWLDLYQTADKNLEPQVCRFAIENFRSAALRSTDSDTVLNIIEAINNETAHVGKSVDFGEKLRKDNLGILLKNDRYRAQLESGGKEAMWQQLEELLFAADLEKKGYRLCSDHFETVFHERGFGVEEETEEHCAVCEVRVLDGIGYFATPAAMCL